MICLSIFETRFDRMSLISKLLLLLTEYAGTSKEMLCTIFTSTPSLHIDFFSIILRRSAFAIISRLVPGIGKLVQLSFLWEGQQIMDKNAFIRTKFMFNTFTFT